MIITRRCNNRGLMVMIRGIIIGGLLGRGNVWQPTRLLIISLGPNIIGLFSCRVSFPRFISRTSISSSRRSLLLSHSRSSNVKIAPLLQ